MAADENALTQPKFELGICGMIQDVFQVDYTTKQKFEKLLAKNLLFSTENSMEIIIFFLKPSLRNLDTFCFK